jgi:hypothetical protein
LHLSSMAHPSSGRHEATIQCAPDAFHDEIPISTPDQ